jgi:hypothetical protein
MVETSPERKPKRKHNRLEEEYKGAEDKEEKENRLT